MKFKNAMKTAVISVATLMLCSCDWSGGGSEGGYNSRFNWVNFSGVYRGAQGGFLITDYTSSPITPDTTFAVVNEKVAVGNGSQTVFNGTVKFKNLTPGSFTISSAGFQLTDNGVGGLSGSGATGAINYGTGSWSIDLGGFAPDNGTPITASYTYGVLGSAAVGPGSGTTKYPIHTFSVAQGGDQVEVVDNNGMSYKGRMGSVRSTSGANQDVEENPSAPAAGDQVIGLYELSGVSKAGLTVRITGTFQGTVGGEGQLLDRRMIGTWLEAGGKTGDVNGQSSPIAITVPVVP
jgi:hypothetical protein